MSSQGSDSDLCVSSIKLVVSMGVRDRVPQISYMDEWVWNESRQKQKVQENIAEVGLFAELLNHSFPSQPGLRTKWLMRPELRRGEERRKGKEESVWQRWWERGVRGEETLHSKSRNSLWCRWPPPLTWQPVRIDKEQLAHTHTERK